MPYHPILGQSFEDFVLKFIEQFLWEIIFLIILAILGSVVVFGRNRIGKWLFIRKIKPALDQTMSVYEKSILPEYVEVKPKIEVVRKKEDIPAELPFGYIFVPVGQEELIWDLFLTYLPISSSIRRIRLLFDENLRKSLFDVLSYQLGMKLDKEEIAVKFRDNAIKAYADDFEVMDKIYRDGKLTAVILYEASKRLRKTKGKVSISDVKEFSKLVRKIAEIDAEIMRIHRRPASHYVEEALKLKRGVVLLARGAYIENAVRVSDELCEKGFEKFTPNELGFSNPETGTWYFVHPRSPKKQVPFMRIWLKRKVID